MDELRMRTTRMTAFVALFLAVMMIGVPSALLNTAKLGAVGQAAAVDDNRQFVVGVIDMTISTLNPNKYTMSAEGMAIFPCYSTLIQYDDNSEIIGDLAYRWSSSPDKLTWEFSLISNAYFYDPSETDPYAHQVTADDIMWTYWALQNDDGSRLHTYWPGVIQSMTAPDPFNLTLVLSQPFVGAMDSFLGCPILPKYYWEGENFLTFKNSPPIGSGPFYYATEGLPTEGLVELKKNPIWYATENMGMDMRVDTWMLKKELDESGAWLELQNHEIDCMLAVPPNLYATELPDPVNHLIGFDKNAGFVYEFNLNQMTDELRAELGGAFTGGKNNQLLLNDTVKKAISYCIDQETFINEVWGGYGDPEATTLVPPENPAHYLYPNPDPFNIPAARQMLIDAGWAYTDTGDPISENPDYLAPLCKAGGADPLSFRFYTLNTGQAWIVGEQLIDGWCEKAGVELLEDELSVTDMNSAWYSANYDLWLWDWIFSVPSEVTGGVLVVLTTEAIGTDSDVYWSNATYDALYRQALQTMDDTERRQITDEMQSMAYEMRGCQSVAYRNELYGVNTLTWTNFGDWNTNYWLLPDVWPTWLCLRMYPNDNHAPDMYSYGGPKTANVNVEATGFYAEADDDFVSTDNLQYRWFWGDNTKTEWSSSGSAVHTYKADGNYTIYVAVRENAIANGYSDYFMTYKKMYCVVSDLSNDAPVINGAITFTPLDPDTGTEVEFTCDATDPEGDTLFFTWDFGDGHSLPGEETITHQYTETGVYECTVSVTDNHYGTGLRPQTGSSGLISVGPNDPPHLTVNDFGSVNVNQKNTYTVAAYDDDSRDSILLTWDWGDGSISVTTDTEADHTYKYRGTYTITVYCDDRTGLDGHNVSGSGEVTVINSKNVAPVLSEYSVSSTSVYTGEEVSFTAVASDGDGDGLTFTFTFGDGTTYVESFDPTSPDLDVECVATHEYLNSGDNTTYVMVSDGALSATSSYIVIEVTANSAPSFVTEPEDVYLETGSEGTFVVDAVDLDGDSITYTWSWGDGSPDTTTVDDGTAYHTYDAGESYVYRVTLDDGCGHDDISAAAHAYVNTMPELEPLGPVFVDAGVERTFTAVATDADSDDLNYTWDFGDGSDPAYGDEVTHTYDLAAIGTVTYSVTVTDGFPTIDEPWATHVLYSENTVTVSDPSVNDPPSVTPMDDITLVVDEVHVFTVEASDPEDAELTITWDFGDLSAPVEGNDIEHSYSVADVYTVTVSVSDGTTTVDDTFDVTVVADEPPTIELGADMTVDEDVVVTFDGSGWTDDLGVVAWDWTIYDDSMAVLDTMIGEHPTYEFADPGVYTVEVVVTDTADQTSPADSITVTVTDATPPTIVMTVDPTSVNMGGSVDFDASGSYDEIDTTLAFEWTVPDGESTTTVTTATFSHTFNVAGEYTVILVVSDQSGNEATEEVVITVSDTEAPLANAGADDEINVGTLYTLDGQASSDNVAIVNWTWTFTDGTAKTLWGETADYTFGNEGVFPITLTVRDDAGLTDTDEVVITVSDLEDPVAVAANVEIYEGETAELDATDSTDNVAVTGWEWVFTYDGEEVTLTDMVSTYQFDIPDVYDVVLTVTDDAGNSDSITITVTVLDDLAPTAAAGDDITDAVVGTEVAFDGSASTDDREIVNWTWSIDSVEVAWGETASYTFDAAGTYTVTLTVTDSFGQTATDSMTVTVAEASTLSDPPVADAGPDETVDVGTEYEFDGAGSTDDVAVVNWTWEFEYDGEMVTLYDANPAFTFDIADEYLVTLTVTDADGQTDVDTMTLTVEEPAEPVDDEKTFLESYGLAIGAIVVVAVLLAVAMLLMKKRKGGKSASGLEGVSSEPEPPSQ